MHRGAETITVSALRYHFGEVKRLLMHGRILKVTKYGKVVACILPVASGASTRRPDFLKRLRAAFGNKVLKVSGAELLAEERERF